jgi:hypothetical protein
VSWITDVPYCSYISPLQNIAGTREDFFKIFNITGGQKHFLAQFLNITGAATALKIMLPGSNLHSLSCQQLS